MPPVSTFRVSGPALRALREERGLSHQQLAEKCGPYRHHKSLLKLETGDGKAVSEKFAQEIAKALGVPVAAFTQPGPGGGEVRPTPWKRVA